LILIFWVVVLLFSKMLFGRIFNQLAIYVTVWSWMLVFYLLKLLPYPPLTSYTWVIIALAFFSFSLGTITVFIARKVFNRPNKFLLGNNSPILFKDNGKLIKKLIIIFGLIGLFSALQNWYVLINKYGSIAKVFLSANEIYRFRQDNAIPGVIPYIQAFANMGIILGGLYSAYKKKITLLLIIPFVAAILKSLAMFGRIGMLIAFVELLVSYFLGKYAFPEVKLSASAKLKKTLSVILLSILLVGSASSIRAFRGTYEKFKGTNVKLNTMKDNIFFSPSIYLYMSSHIGVLNAFLKNQTEETMIGENTFAPFYNLFSKFEITKRVSYNQKGYYIPMWTNSGTILRDFYADYGIVGVLFIPYLLGMLGVYWWNKFYSTGKAIYFVLIVHIYTIIVLSFLSSVTRGADWFVSLGVLLIAVIVVEKRLNTFYEIPSKS